MLMLGTKSVLCIGLVACVATAACDKPGGATADTASSAKAAPAAAAPSSLASVAATAAAPSVPAPEPVAASASAASAPAASAPAARLSGSAAQAPSAPAASASGKLSANGSPAASAALPAGEPLVPARGRVDGKNFALDVSSPGCRVDTDCAVTIRLSPTGEYHVNKEYPYKFVAQAAPTHAFLGKDDPNTFSKAAGDYREEGEKSATMTVRFRAKSAGEAKVTGTYKMSVCSAENCQIETPRVELAVAVK